MSIPMMMCPWAFGGCDRSRRWGRRWCGRGLFCVLWSSCALYSPLAPLVSSKSPPPSRWAVGQRLSARYPPVFFWLKKAGSAQGRPKILPTYLGCMLPSDKKNRLLVLYAFFQRTFMPFFNLLPTVRVFYSDPPPRFLPRFLRVF